MSKDSGGPAFPTPWAGGECTEGGMTLRDWFAGQAMNGLMSDSAVDGPRDDIAEWSYAMADAMLEARKDET